MNDEFEHITTGLDCPCGPTKDPENPYLIIHYPYTNNEVINAVEYGDEL